MNHAYTSLNRALGAAWAAIATGDLATFTITDIESAAPAPPVGLRVLWESNGEPTRTAGTYEASLDLAICVPAVGGQPDRATALRLATELDRALGFLGTAGGNGGTGTGALGRFDYTVTPARWLSEMELAPDGGWEILPTGSPGQVCRARTVKLRFKTNAVADGA